MLIDKPEQVLFDFNNRYAESLSVLADDILFASGREHFPMDDPSADLLLELLQSQQIGVFAQKYTLEKDAPAGYNQKINELADLVGKRTPGLIGQALHIYKDLEPQKRRNEYNTLYYPDLKAYVRFGNLRPVKLLDMLAEDNCDGVILFRDCVDSDTEDRFFLFMLGMPQPEYRAILETAREKQNDAMLGAVQMAAERSNNIFPEIPKDETP